MEFTGKVVSAGKDWNTDKYNITFSVNESSVMNELNDIKDCEKLQITAKKHRNKRSLDANAYAWVLMQKIAEKTNSDRWSIYLELLKRYSRAFTFLIVKENAVKRTMEQWRECIDLGEVEVGGQKGHQLQVFFGSSTFDSKEMSVFIDGIVSECKEMGIETIPPAELERIKSLWSQ